MENKIKNELTFLSSLESKDKLADN